MFRLEPRVTECRKLHALADYGLINVKYYEDIVQHGSIATTYDYPVLVNDRYLTSPSPIPGLRPTVPPAWRCSTSSG